MVHILFFHLQLVLESISIPKAKKALKKLRAPVKTEEIFNFVEGTSEDSTLDESTFLRLAARLVIQTEKANKAFELFDKDNKGVVVLQDLSRVCRELGENFTEEEVKEMVDLVDRSSDGLLNKNDFGRIARKVKL
jgi:Ca2+-binding EF-hand superfamily protein